MSVFGEYYDVVVLRTQDHEATLNTTIIAKLFNGFSLLYLVGKAVHPLFGVISGYKYSYRFLRTIKHP